MNSQKLIAYFTTHGWTLTRDTETRLGGWLFGPIGTLDTPRRFSSLKGVWHWWRSGIECALKWEVVAEHAFSVYRDTPESSEIIRTWALHDGDIPEDLMLEACRPLFVDPVLPPWEQHSHRLASSCWPTTHEHFMPLLCQKILDHERDALAEATIHAERAASLPQARL